MALRIDPSKIRSKYGLATVITLVFESLFLLWFNSAANSYERIAAGMLAALVLIVFLFRVFSRETAPLDPSAKKLIGKWEIHSVSQKGTKGDGTLNISNVGNNICLSGVLCEEGKTVGTFNSEVTRVNENRLIFYYVLRDQKKFENMDAISIVVFNPVEPNELNGEWIVASKTPRHGSVTYKRIDT